MAFVRYEQLPLKIGFDGSTADESLFVTNFTATDNMPLAAVRSLGFNGAISTTATGPIDGSWSMTYLPVTGGNIGQPCYSANDLDNETGIISGIRMGPTTFPVILTLGGQTIFKSGAINSYNISVEPNSVITADVGGNFYDCKGMTPTAGGISAGSATLAGGGNSVAHGSTSNFSGAGSTSLANLGFSENPFNATYAASRGLTPIYTIGKLSPGFIMPTDPQEQLSLQGNNIPSGLVIGCEGSTGPTCLGGQRASFALRDSCNNLIQNFDVCGFATSRDISIAENDVLRGNVTIVDYTLPQIL